MYKIESKTKSPSIILYHCCATTPDTCGSEIDIIIAVQFMVIISIIIVIITINIIIIIIIIVVLKEGKSNP